MKYAIIISLFALASCHTHDHDGHHHSHDTHAVEFPRAGATAWTERFELFADFPVMLADKENDLAIHVTDLQGYVPVSEGRLEFSLISADGKVVASAIAEQPVEPGIFLLKAAASAAGEYQMAFNFFPGEDSYVFKADGINVYADEQAAMDAQVESTDITFTKEQAWNIDFEIRQAAREVIYDVVNSSGVWKTAPGAAKSLVAPVSGVVSFKTDKLTDGGIIGRGLRLMAISSDQLTSENLGVEVEQARSRFEQAEAEYLRKSALYELRIIPRAEYEAVESRYNVAKSAYELLSKGYASGAKSISAPFSGYVKAVHVQNGDFVSEGDKLITLATDQSKILESHISPAYAVSAEDIQNIWYQPSPGTWSSLNEAGGTLLSVSEQVSADHPMAAVFAQVNEEVKTPAGGFSEVQIALGEEHPGIVIPETALLEDYGNYSVIVQLSGETYERRPVKTGRRNGDHVEITRGLSEGERVVTTGAYQVRMASMSGELPAHGHEH
jgi:RND family efflux transporter MFP subunit